MTAMENGLKRQFLDRVGYVCKRDESPGQAFDRLRQENPDLFPVPRCNESFWDAIRDAVR